MVRCLRSFSRWLFILKTIRFQTAVWSRNFSAVWEMFELHSFRFFKSHCWALNAKNAEKRWKINVSRHFHSGASGRNRTIDTGIFSPLLYRLSYRGKSWRPGWGSNPRPLAWQASVLTNWTTGPFGGNNRARTCDPLLVRQVLSQLSYAPIFTENCHFSSATNIILQ